jgi:hypothetical protein
MIRAAKQFVSDRREWALIGGVVTFIAVEVFHLAYASLGAL